MNLRVVRKYMGALVLAEAAFMLPPALVGLIYAEPHVVRATLLSAMVCLAVGLALFLPLRGEHAPVYARESFVVAGAGWLLVSLFGALPFFLSGQVPRFSDAFFESVAGFTTTGTFLHSRLEDWSRGMLFWRNFIQWLGGVGVLTFVLALVRGKSGSGFGLNLFRAESPGPQVGKVAPRIRDSVRHIYIIYVGLSALNLIMLLIGGMPLFEALCIMFGTAGTGGFGVLSDSMASYSPYLQGVCTVFMCLFGVNFALYHLLLRGQPKAALMDEELRFYVLILLASTGIIATSLMTSGFGGLLQSLHNASFMTASVITSTGMSIGDYTHWPALARAVLFVIMIVGSMGGSTAGGFKVGRVLILFKSLRAGLYRISHPRSVITMRMNGKPITDDVFARAQLFLFMYCVVVLGSFLLISVDGMPLEANLTAVMVCSSNTGPGFGLVSSVLSFDDYSTFSKLVLSFNMLLGRLEYIPIVVLFMPATWKMKT